MAAQDTPSAPWLYVLYPFWWLMLLLSVPIWFVWNGHRAMLGTTPLLPSSHCLLLLLQGVRVAIVFAAYSMAGWPGLLLAAILGWRTLSTSIQWMINAYRE